jgi:hypothetical protein
LCDGAPCRKISTKHTIIVFEHTKNAWISIDNCTNLIIIETNRHSLQAELVFLTVYYGTHLFLGGIKIDDLADFTPADS